MAGFAGVNAFGTVESLDHNGNQIDKHNLGMAGTFGISASFSY